MSDESTMAGDSTLPNGPRVSGREVQLPIWGDFDSDRHMMELDDHPAVTNHGDGISTEDFASFQECFANYAGSRIRGVGKRQYFDGERQRFEVYSPDELANEMLDELADVVNYASMLAVKVLKHKDMV